MITDFSFSLHSRMQNKFTTDLKELEHSERNFRDKYAEVRSQLAEAEANRENAQASAKQFELQLNYTQRVISLTE